MDSQYPNYVCKINRALYGLRQAPRAWFQRFTTYLQTLGFHGSKSDYSMFVYKSAEGMAILLLYVDDIILTASSPSLLQRILTRLKDEFSMNDLGHLNYFLGIHVVRNTDGLFLSQQKYATELLQKADMLQCKSVDTPICTRHSHSLSVAKFRDPTLYRSIVGGLQYLTFTRPDLTYAVNYVCQHMHDPLETHW